MKVISNNKHVWIHHLLQACINKSLAIMTAPCHLISAGGEFDFSLVRLPAHNRELGQLCFLKQVKLQILCCNIAKSLNCTNK